jgi:CubicO group peptidase (beta-lactamase class C family)
MARRTLAENHVSGAQIAVLNSGHLVWAQSFGIRTLDPKQPMQNTTTTWVASITKSVFATYVMQLSERGELPLDEPIQLLLPEPLYTYEPYRDTASELVRDGRWATITPRMLLSHTSGLANFASGEPDKKMHLHFTPGTRYSYSGEGLNLLQFVVEQRLHKPLDVLMQEAIFTPLHMDHTGLVYRESFGSDIADRFDENEKFISKIRRDRARAAGSMTSSATDLATFLTALFANRIVQPASLNRMLTPVISINREHQFPTLDEVKDAEAQSVGLAYGLGWGLLTRTAYGKAFFKEGGSDGTRDYLICFERTRDCMILLTNSDNGDLAFRPLLEGILGDTATPWNWEGYNRETILASREHQSNASGR